MVTMLKISHFRFFRNLTAQIVLITPSSFNRNRSIVSSSFSKASSFGSANCNKSRYWILLSLLVEFSCVAPMYLIQHIISPHFPNINLAVLQQFLHLFCTIHLLHCNNKDFRTLLLYKEDLEVCQKFLLRYNECSPEYILP